MPTRRGAPERATRAWQWRIFALTWVAYIGYYLVRQATPAMIPGILEDPVASRILDRPTLGHLSACYLIAYAVGQFFWGALADRYGVRRIVTLGMFASALAALLMGIVPALLLFFPLMILLGLAQASGWAPLCKNIAAFFPVHRRGKIMGLWSTNYACGALIGTPFAAWVAYTVGDDWRLTMLVPGALLLLLTPVFWRFQRNSPAEIPELGAAMQRGGAEPAPDTPAAPAGRAPLRELLHNRTLWVLAVAYFLLKPMRYLVLLWGPLLVADSVEGVSLLVATLIPAAFAAAGLLAPVAAGWASDALFASRRMPPAILGLGGTVLMLLLIVPAARTGSVPLLTAAFGLLGFFLYCADSVLSAVAAVDAGTPGTAAGTVGIINGCGAVGAVLGGWLPGIIGEDILYPVFAGGGVLAILLLLPGWRRGARAIRPSSGSPGQMS